MNKTKDFIQLMFDPMFKHIFGDSRYIDFTKKFVHDVTNIPYEKLEDAILTNGEELSKDNINDKAFSCDIMMRLKNGMKIIIESQNQNYFDSELKNIFYGLRELLIQAPRGKKIKNIKPIYQIIIINNDYVKRKIVKKLINQFHIIEKDNNRFTLLNGLYTLKIIDIKSEKGYSDINEDLKKWIDLLRAKTLLEAKEAAKNAKIIEKVLKEMINFMEENYVRTYKEKYEDDMKFLRKLALKEGIKRGRNEGLEKGRNEGIEKGRNEANIEMAKKLLEKNISIKDIEDITGLSYNKITSLF